MSPSTDFLQISGIGRAYPDRALWYVDHAVCVYQLLDGFPNIVDCIGSKAQRWNCMKNLPVYMLQPAPAWIR